jgi:hypothetical protein
MISKNLVQPRTPAFTAPTKDRYPNLVQAENSPSRLSSRAVEKAADLTKTPISQYTANLNTVP